MGWHADEEWSELNGCSNGPPPPPAAAKPTAKAPAPRFHTFESRSGCLHMNGERFHLKARSEAAFDRVGRLTLSTTSEHKQGVTWGEMDSEEAVFDTLEGQPLSAVLDFLVDEGFNALRLLVGVGLALDLDGKRPSIGGRANPALQGLTAGQLLDVVIREAAKRGILVVLAMTIQPVGDWEERLCRLWYSEKVSESELTQAWLRLVKRFAPCWNFIGADLCDELHKEASWGSGDARTDWRLAAEGLGNAILLKCPRLLIFVQGVEKNCHPHQSAEPCFWGGALCSAEEKPVELSVQHRVVYAPHVFGPCVWDQPYFADASFPFNLPEIWNDQFMRARGTGAAVVIGAWGGVFKHNSPDRAWGEAFVAYLRDSTAFDSFFYKLEHEGGLVEGLLKADGRSPNRYKLDLLDRLCPCPSRVKPPAGAVQP